MVTINDKLSLAIYARSIPSKRFGMNTYIPLNISSTQRLFSVRQYIWWHLFVIGKIPLQTITSIHSYFCKQVMLNIYNKLPFVICAIRVHIKESGTKPCIPWKIFNTESFIFICQYMWWYLIVIGKSSLQTITSVLYLFYKQIIITIYNKIPLVTCAIRAPNKQCQRKTWTNPRNISNMQWFIFVFVYM